MLLENKFVQLLYIKELFQRNWEVFLPYTNS